MNIKLIGGALVGIAVLGGALFFISSEPRTLAPSTQTNTDERTSDFEATPSSFSGTLKDLATRGGNVRCTFSHESDVANSSGVVYVSGNNIRGDFLSETRVGGSFSVESHMITKDGYTYAWTSLSPQGFRAKTTSEGNASSPDMSASFADHNQAYDYDCVSATIDQTLFDLPDIVFTDVN